MLILFFLTINKIPCLLLGPILTATACSANRHTAKVSMQYLALHPMFTSLYETLKELWMFVTEI